MLHMAQTVQKEIEAQGVAAYPYEGCGLLLGQAQNGHNRVVAAFPVPNRWPDEEEKRIRFQITPQDMLRAEMEAMRRGLDVVGVFHSHPDDEPVASPRDLAWAAWPGYSYLITAVHGGQVGRSRSWQLKEDRSGFIEEEIQLDPLDP